jgi:hypothetical protein
MHRATHRSPLALFSTLLVFLMMAAAPSLAAPKGKPLSQQDVLELLEGAVPSQRIAEIVNDRGIDFPFTAEVERRVRKAKGDDDLVDALKQASARRAESEPAGNGVLVVVTTPGEAEVYLDDVPKGTTSTKGEIRLPDLSPGAYTLRVSLPGYQSYEKPATVVAGEERRIYVTLTQKSAPPAVPPETRPSVDTTTPAVGLPIPGLKTPTLQFYEGEHDTTPGKSKRVYRFSFDRFSTRSVYWELDLNYPSPGKRIEFQVDAFWYKADGTEMTRQTLSGYAQADWQSSWHTLGYGWADAGHWTPGTYRVDLYYRNMRVASGTFQIN